MHATRELGLTGMGAALSAGLVLMCGCAQQSGVDDRRVTASDFRSGLIGPPGEFDRARAGIGPEMSRLDPRLGFDTRLGERAVLDIAVVTGPPGPGSPSATMVERPVLVEEKVGEINGTPVFAGDFFDEQFAGRLRADARTKAPEAWRNDAAKEIGRKLNTLVQESLLTQEGRSHLTPEQQQTLFLWLNKWEKDLRSRHMGSVQLTERALGEDGRTLAQWRDERERGALIMEAARRVYSTVQVTPTDMRRAYDKHYGRFNHGWVELRQILVRADQAEAIGRVKEQLGSGAAFAEIASQELNGYRRDQGGLMDRRSYEGDFETAVLFERPALDEAVGALSPGEWAGPIELGDTGLVVWILCEARAHTAIPWYEAQLQIESDLLNEERRSALNRYVKKLEERASFTDLNQMGVRLLEIAQERYHTPGGE